MPSRILIVDAEPLVRSVVAAIVKHEGYEVTETDDIKAVLEIVMTERLALIITNVSLPGITGHDAMLLFKRVAPDVPVLMMSGLPDADMIRNWKRQPGFDVFPKPFDARDLSAKVRQMVAAHGRAKS